MTEPNPVIDPRQIITQDAFRVSPELLGRPLATPKRRAAAMAIDGILLAILSSTASVFLGLAAAYVLFRISRTSPQTGYIRRSIRMMFRISAAIVLFVVVLSAGRGVANWGDDEPAEEAVAGTEGAVTMSGMEGLAMAAEVLAFRQADTESEAIEVAESVRDGMFEAGMTDSDVRELLTEMAEGTDRPWLLTAVDSVTRSEEVVGDTVVAGEVDSLALLRREIEELQGQQLDLIEQLGDARDAAENPDTRGILAWLGTLADDLGLGLGWSGLYFTAFMAIGRGRTPGKRAMGIRVIRLDGIPIGWWAAFERFGGYAASFATGLLGFFQIFWDDNRQAIHDRIAFTVVVKE